MDKNDRKSDVTAATLIQPLIVAKLVHTKTADHRIVECIQTSTGLAGRRPSTYEMKVSNYDLSYEGKTLVDRKRKHDHEWVMAIRNRRTGKTTFSPFDLVRFKGKIEIPEELRNATTVLNSSNFAEMRKRVIMEFGTKKAQKALNSSLRNTLDESATKQLFVKAMSHMQQAEEAKRAKLDDKDEAKPNEEPGTSGQQKPTQTSAVLPPFNPTAKTPADIYKISDIVPDDLLDVLKPEAERYLRLSPKEAKEEGHPALVMALIQMTASMKDADQRSTKVAYCLYLSYLIRLNNLIGGYTRFVAPNEFMVGASVPYAVISDLMHKFTSAGGIGAGTAPSLRTAVKLSVTGLHKDMLLANIAVLLLILSGQYAFNTQKVLQDLGVSEKKVGEIRFTQICTALGCRMQKHKQSGAQICVLEKPPKQRNVLLGANRGRGKR